MILTFTLFRLKSEFYFLNSHSCSNKWWYNFPKMNLIFKWYWDELTSLFCDLSRFWKCKISFFELIQRQASRAMFRQKLHSFWSIFRNLRKLKMWKNRENKNKMRALKKFLFKNIFIFSQNIYNFLKNICLKKFLNEKKIFTFYNFYHIFGITNNFDTYFKLCWPLWIQTYRIIKSYFFLYIDYFLLFYYIFLFSKKNIL